MSLPNPDKISIEITSRCNLLCTTCLRDINNKSSDMELEFFASLVEQAKAFGPRILSLTGGEPTIHPRFLDMARVVIESGFRLRVITNAFRPDPLFALAADADLRKGVDHIALSLDGASESVHDTIRGRGSYRKVLMAAGVLRMRGVPFNLQFIINNFNFAEIEAMALLGGKIGASRLDYGFYLPTLREYDAGLRMTPDAMISAQDEIARLARIFRMPIALAVGVHPRAPLTACGVMEGETWHINWLGQLSLCCQLSNLYDEKRPGKLDTDVVADLRQVSMADAFTAFQDRMDRLMKARINDHACGRMDEDDIWPCHYCMKHFEKQSVVAAPAAEVRHA